MRERKRQRMEGYDYSTPGAYFVTICVHDRHNVFGVVRVATGSQPFLDQPNPPRPIMKLNESGKIAENCWLDLPNHYPNCRLDQFVIMPNHVHGIVWVVGQNVFADTFVIGNGLKPFPTVNTKTAFPPLNPFPATKMAIHNSLDNTPVKMHGLPEMMRGFKTFSSRRINELNPGFRFQWQKSYHDRIIRNEDELDRIRKYIIQNPANWLKDRENNTQFDKELVEIEELFDNPLD
jgi:REP element-mobilizing transposase RayT